ncbi:hypothetical protein CLV98_1461, partial [Dyadobacter jejuensis]
MLHQLISEKLAMEPKMHERLAMLVLAGKLDFTSFSSQRQQPYFAYDDGGSRSAYQRLDKVESKAGRVVIIPLQGAMS